MIKTHAKKKTGKYRGKRMGSFGHGARKMARKSGQRGGTGMAGTGKRADHKKTLMTKLYGNKYFGKQGITSRGTEKDKADRINLAALQMNLDNFVKAGIAKKTAKGFEFNLEDYKVLGTGDLKMAFVIKAKAFSKQAEEKIKAAGGEAIVAGQKPEKDSE
jgi:large subunit ribosomal protein L15